MLDANNGWAWTNSGQMLRTADGGQTWMDRTPGEAVGPEGSFFLDSQTAWQPFLVKASSRFGLLHTRDGGQTWTQVSYGPQNFLGPALILHFTDALNGWAVTGDGGAGSFDYSLSRTQDGGKTWAPIPVKAPTAEAGWLPGTVHICSGCEDSFYYDPERILIVHGDEAAMESTGAVRMQVSFDLGDSWMTRALPLPKDTPDAAVGSAYPTFFSGGNGLMPVQLIKTDNNGNTIYQHLAFYATQDGGANWSLLPGVLDEVSMNPQMQVISPKDIFVLCGSALCASHDGAQTWQQLASNLDLTQTDTRSASAMDFVDAATGWALIQLNENPLLYKTTDGGVTWNQLNPLLAASSPVTVTLDASIPTPTPLPTRTLEPTPTPDVAFDQKINAYRIQFAPYGTWVEINDTVKANTPKRYVLSAMQRQVMSVAIPQGPAFSVAVAGADKKPLSDLHYPQPFWRGALPSTQDYIVTVESQVSGPFTLRIAINPPGQATQNFEFVDPQYMVALSYTDEFAPTNVQVPVNIKGTPLLTLAFIDPTFYSPTTNLNEAYLVLAATSDPAVVSTCTQPSAQVGETVTGQVTVNNYTFTRSEFDGAAAGNLYEQIAYRTVVDNKCFEVIYLIHSGNISNYPAGTVVAFDQDALLKKFEAVLATFGAK
jgi:photosystem II stability/assembly factor-like uncharacterized protein